MIKNFEDVNSETVRVMSASDPGYKLTHDNLFSDNAIMLLSEGEKTLTVHSYGNSDVSKNNIISLDLQMILADMSKLKCYITPILYVLVKASN